MGKVISLKLNAEEEKIVNQLRKKGVTPSSLIRDALWQYFGKNDIASDADMPTTPNPSQNPYLDKYIAELEKEVDFWKIKYDNLDSFWKLKFDTLADNYNDRMKETLCEIDTKFELLLTSMNRSTPSKKSEPKEAEPIESSPIDAVVSEEDDCEAEVDLEPSQNVSLSSKIDEVLQKRYGK